MGIAPKTNRREYPREKIGAVCALHAEEYSYGAIALRLKIPRSSVGAIVRREAQRDLGFSPKKRTGRPRKVTDRGVRAIKRHVLTQPFDTLISLTSPSKAGIKVCKNTVRTILKQNEIYAFRPRKKPFLKPAHKTKRLQFSRLVVKWSEPKHKTVSYSDESNFELGLDSSAPWVRRPPGKAYESNYLTPTFKSGRSVAGVWGAISWDFKSKLYFLKKGERMNAKKYIAVLEEAGLEHYNKIKAKRGSCIWQDDGAKYHTAKATKAWLKEKGIERLDWPAQSPDLNPIENLWAIMKRRISKIRYRIHSLDELKDIMQETWDGITQDEIRTLIGSMSKRCQQVIEAKGGATKY